MKKALALLLAVTVLLGTVLATAGCSGSKEIRIGFVAQVSGSDAYVGQTAKLALEDYINELNTKGGILGKKVKLIIYDTASDATQAVNVTKRLIEQDKVSAIIGPEWSGGAIPLAPIVDAAKVPLVATTATNTLVTVDENGKLNPYMFRVSFIDPYQGYAISDFAYNELGKRKVAFLTDVTAAYSKAIQDYFEKHFTELGGSVADKEGYQANDVEFRAQLSKIAKSGADCLVVPTATYRDIGLIAKQAKALGLKIQFLGVDGWYADELMAMAGDELEGAYMSSGVSDTDPQFAAYNASFAQKHPGQKVNIYAYYALDAMMAVQAAMEQTGKTDPESVKNGLENLKDAQVFTSKLTIEKDTHNPHNKPILIIKISGKKFNVDKTYQPQ
ncbi:MAG: ABC transporter substrate-binding protein [Bacillota bacterium]